MGEVLDGYAMSERILLTIDNILKNDTELRDFTILSSETNVKNKSPVLYESHSLGLESWCIKPVYQYVCGMLFTRRKKLVKKKLPYTEMESMNYLLNGALLINPDVYTFWNMKKQLVEGDILSVQRELHFSKIVLTFKSKSNEAFAYRRWLLKKVLDKISVNKVQIPPNLLQDELAVVHMASEKSQNNYHSWNHRIWCIENIANICPNFSNIVYSELSYSQEWINCHVSEHSGYHYRQYLVTLLKDHKKIILVYELYYNFVINKFELIKEDKYANILTYLLGTQNKKRIIDESPSFINYICILFYDLDVLYNEICQHYSGHQSLYYHRRFLIFHLLRVPFEHHGIPYSQNTIIQRNVNLWNENIVTVDTALDIPINFNIRFESVNLSNCMLIETITSCEKLFISNHQDYLTKEYYKWLINVAGFQ